MTLDFSTFQTIAHIEGQSMVLMDGDAFAAFSKLLMFKNKKRNIIDSLSFEILVEDNEMQVFTSLVTMDRYKIAIGGNHKLDMNYYYHISVLKSAMPFKAGIDLKGNLTEFDFKVTKAKYKYLFSDKKRHEKNADLSLIKQKEAILSRLTF